MQIRERPTHARGLLRRLVDPAPPRPARARPGPGEVVAPGPGRRHLRHRPAARPGLHGLPGRPRPRVRRPDRRRPPRDRRDQQRLPRLPDLPRRPAQPLPEPDRPGHPRPRRRDGRPGPRPRRATSTTIPDAIDDREAVFIEPLAAAFRIAEQVAARPGRRTGRSSATASSACSAPGSPGSRGPSVTLVGKHPTKLALAGEGIATHTLDDGRDARARSFDVVADCTGLAIGPADRPGPGPAVRDGRPEDDGRRRRTRSTSPRS